MISTQADLVRAVNELANTVRVSRVPDHLVRQVCALIAQASSMLGEHVVLPPYAAEQLSPPSQRTLHWDAEDLRRTLPYSPFLGDLNPIAGQARVWADDDEVRGTVKLSQIHVGPIDTVHGGVVAALLDELTSLAVMAIGRIGYTRTLTVTYHRPTPIGAELSLWARTGGQTGRVFLTSGEIRHAGTVTASAVAVHHAAGRRDEPAYPEQA